jgi:hypothetical protein
VLLNCQSIIYSYLQTSYKSGSLRTKNMFPTQQEYEEYKEDYILPSMLQSPLFANKYFDKSNHNIQSLLFSDLALCRRAI